MCDNVNRVCEEATRNALCPSVVLLILYLETLLFQQSFLPYNTRTFSVATVIALHESQLHVITRGVP